MAHCMRHYEEPVVAECRTCHQPYCSRCLVFSFGPNQQPYCVGCALTASGVRNKSKTVVSAPPPTVDRKAERLRKREERSQVKALRKSARHGDVPAVEETERHSNVPMPAGLATPSSRFASTAPKTPTN